MRGIRTSLQATKISVNETTAKETKLTMSAHMRGLQLQTNERGKRHRRHMKIQNETWKLHHLLLFPSRSSGRRSCIQCCRRTVGAATSTSVNTDEMEKNAHTTKKMRRQELAAP